MKKVFLSLVFAVLAASLQAQWLPILASGVTAPGGGGGSSPVLTWITSANDATDATTYTFTSQSIGDPADRDYVLVAIAGRRSGFGAIGMDSVFIGGVAATQRAIGTYSESGTLTYVTALYSASVPSGTTANVVVAFNTGSVCAGISVYAIKGASSIVPFDTAGGGGFGTSLNLNCDTPSGNSVALAAFFTSGGDAVMGWAVSLNEDTEMFWESARNFSSAHNSFSSAATQTITGTVGSSTNMCGISASFQ